MARIVTVGPSAPDHQGICVIVGNGCVRDITVEQPDVATMITHQVTNLDSDRTRIVYIRG